MEAKVVTAELGAFQRALVDLFVTKVAATPRDLRQSGYPKYQKKELDPFFGYDQWVGWMAIPEIMWMRFQDVIGFAPGISPYLDLAWCEQTLAKMTTKEMDSLEKKPEIGHDVNAMLLMLRRELPLELHRFPHFAWTSYDPLEQARALMFLEAYRRVVRPAMVDVECLLRTRIDEFGRKIQMHRTHLQYALPATVGFWLSVIHSYFVESVRNLDQATAEITGKMTGAIGTSAALIAFDLPGMFQIAIPDANESMESFFLTKVMGLGKPTLSTQIVNARRWSNFLFQAYQVSTVLGQLGEDSRILQASGIGEVLSVSSTSSTMAHKDSNPITAEGMVGMCRLSTAELLKPLLNVISDLGRDLCNSRVARDYQTLFIYLFQQLKDAERLLSKMSCNDERLQQNFGESKYLVMAELLYLSLSKAGMPEAHRFVNKQVVPTAKIGRTNLVQVMDGLAHAQSEVGIYWEAVPGTVKELMLNPEKYLGNAVKICLEEAENAL